ncbi:MAG TPA: MTH1187 family thiamine-binding protein [Chroococcales cyanobacterium]
MAEFSIIPLAGVEMRPYVDAAVQVVRESGLKFEVEPLGTSLEGEFDEVMETIKKAHLAALECGAGRVLTEIRIDEKKEAPETMEKELSGYR